MATPEPRDAFDLERSQAPPTCRQMVLSLPSLNKSQLDKSSTVCFVCLDRPRDGQYAVRVPCLKSNRGRKIRKGLVLLHGKELVPWDAVLEDDRAVYIRMLEVSFQHLGNWKKWLPFYGVVSVTEVVFQFDGRISRDGRFFGLMMSVDIEKTKKDCQEAIDMEPVPGEDNGWDHCGSAGHAKDCDIAMTHWDQKCLTVSAEKAKERLRRIPLRYLLTTCARNPAEANGLDPSTLSGMTQDSCIYPTCGADKVEIPSMNKPWNGKTPIRALHFAFGWQTDRIKLELPYLVSVGGFGIAIVWFAVLVSRGTGFDWNGALALGQVVAASVTILITSLRY